MGILQKKRRTTGKKALAYRGKGDQNTDTAFLALRLGVVLYLPIRAGEAEKQRLKNRVWPHLELYSASTFQGSPDPSFKAPIAPPSGHPVKHSLSFFAPFSKPTASERQAAATEKHGRLCSPRCRQCHLHRGRQQAKRC